MRLGSMLAQVGLKLASCWLKNLQLLARTWPHVGSQLGSMLAQVGLKLASCWLKLAQVGLMLAQVGSN